LCHLRGRRTRDLQDFFVIDRLTANSGRQVGDQREAQAPHPKMTGGYDFENCRHTHEIRSKLAKHLDFGRSLEARSGQAGIDTSTELDAEHFGDMQGLLPKMRVMRVDHVGKLGPPLRRWGASQGVESGSVQLVSDDSQVSRLLALGKTSSRVGHHQGSGTQETCETNHEDGLIGVVSLVGVKAAALIEDYTVF